MSAAPPAKSPPPELCIALHAFHRQLEQATTAPRFSDIQVLSAWMKALLQNGYEASLEQRFLNVGTSTDHYLCALVAGSHRWSREGVEGWDKIVQAHGCMPMQPNRFYWHACEPEPIEEHVMAMIMSSNKLGDRQEEYDAMVRKHRAFIQGWTLDSATPQGAGYIRPRSPL